MAIEAATATPNAISPYAYADRNQWREKKPVILCKYEPMEDEYGQPMNTAIGKHAHSSGNPAQSGRRIDEASLIDDVRSVCSLLDANCSEKYISCVSSEQYEQAQSAIFDQRGFCVRRNARTVQKDSHGQEEIGVYVSKGSAPENALVAVYPGTVYQPREKVFLQTRCNPFVYRCQDSTLIDGSNRAISKLTYRSCTLRDRLTPHLINDMTWLTPMPVNPLAIGQYVDAQSADAAANVYYQEINLPLEQFPVGLQRFIPNAPYSNVNGCKALRMVLLMSSRKIEEGEGLHASLPRL